MLPTGMARGMPAVLWTLAISLSAQGGQQQKSRKPALMRLSVHTKQAMKRSMDQARMNMMFKAAKAENQAIEGRGVTAPRAKATAEPGE